MESFIHRLTEYRFTEKYSILMIYFKMFMWHPIAAILLNNCLEGQPRRNTNGQMKLIPIDQGFDDNE